MDKTRVDEITIDNKQAPNDFEILITSSMRNDVKIGVDRFTFYGEVHGPHIYFRGIALQPDDAQALINVLQEALIEIAKRRPELWPTPTKEAAEAWMKDQANGSSFKRLKPLGFYREPGHECPQCGSDQTNQMTDRAWDCSACGNEWLAEPVKMTSEDVEVLTAGRVKLSKSQMHHLQVAKARQANPHFFYGEWVEPSDSYVEQKATGKFLRHSCFRALWRRGLVEKQLMYANGYRTVKCVVYRITSDGINALKSNGID